MQHEIVNKVKANTKLVTLDLEKNFADQTEIAELDIKDFLFMELMLKEKEFRTHLKNFDWSIFSDKYLAVYCSTDAIVAPWAWMLITTYAKEYAKEVFFSTASQIKQELYARNINKFDWSTFEDKFVLVKGCSDKSIPESAYLMATNKLMNIAKKVMYGEACSFVPVYSKK